MNSGIDAGEWAVAMMRGRRRRLNNPTDPKPVHNSTRNTFQFHGSLQWSGQPPIDANQNSSNAGDSNSRAPLFPRPQSYQVPATSCQI